MPTATMPLGYLFYLPPGYQKADRERRWPLLLFLHGAGERGSNLSAVARHGPPLLIEQGRVLPFIVISPQCPTGGHWEPSLLAQLLDQVEQAWSVDASRVYITGMSMGGYGTWRLVARQPRRFAAAAMVCGGGHPSEAPCMAHVPLWLFHGEQDEVVPASESLVLARALQSVGGNVRLTLYPDAGHDAWTETYSNPALYEWFLEQRLP